MMEEYLLSNVVCMC